MSPLRRTALLVIGAVVIFGSTWAYQEVRAEEAPLQAQEIEIPGAEAELEEPVVLEEPMVEEKGLRDRLAKAFHYAIHGDASEIVLETDVDLSTRSASIIEHEAALADREQELDLTAGELDKMRELLSERREYLTRVQSSLTSCVMSAMEIKNDQ